MKRVIQKLPFIKRLPTLLRKGYSKGLATLVREKPSDVFQVKSSIRHVGTDPYASLKDINDIVRLRNAMRKVGVTSDFVGGASHKPLVTYESGINPVTGRATAGRTHFSSFGPAKIRLGQQTTDPVRTTRNLLRSDNLVTKAMDKIFRVNRPPTEAVLRDSRAATLMHELSHVRLDTGAGADGFMQPMQRITNPLDPGDPGLLLAKDLDSPFVEGYEEGYAEKMADQFMLRRYGKNTPAENVPFETFGQAYPLFHVKDVPDHLSWPVGFRSGLNTAAMEVASGKIFGR